MCVCRRDEAFLESFLVGWSAVWGRSGAKLVLASDVLAPVEGEYGLEVIDLDWPRLGPIAAGVVRTFQEALDRWPAEWVFKHDVDMVHIHKGWWRPEVGHRFGGVRNFNRMWPVYGGCWGMQAELMQALDSECGWYDEPYEDVAISRAVLEAVGEEGIYYASTSPRERSALRGAGSLARHRDEWGPECGMLHSGEHGKTAAGRLKSLEWQRAAVAALYG